MQHHLSNWHASDSDHVITSNNVRNNTAAFTDILTCGRCVVMSRESTSSAGRTWKRQAGRSWPLGLVFWGCFLGRPSWSSLGRIRALFDGPLAAPSEKATKTFICFSAHSKRCATPVREFKNRGGEMTNYKYAELFAANVHERAAPTHRP